MRERNKFLKIPEGRFYLHTGPSAGEDHYKPAEEHSEPTEEDYYKPTEEDYYKPAGKSIPKPTEKEHSKPTEEDHYKTAERFQVRLLLVHFCVGVREKVRKPTKTPVNEKSRNNFGTLIFSAFQEVISFLQLS